jgi:hypothetical protein
MSLGVCNFRNEEVVGNGETTPIDDWNFREEGPWVGTSSSIEDWKTKVGGGAAIIPNANCSNKDGVADVVDNKNSFPKTFCDDFIKGGAD